MNTCKPKLRDNVVKKRGPDFSYRKILLAVIANEVGFSS